MNHNNFSSCIYKLLILASLLYQFNPLNGAVISFAFRDYPIVKSAYESQKFADSLSLPGTAAKTKLEKLIAKRLTAGIIGTYAGYTTVSNLDGRIIFPRLQNSTTLYLIVTTKMTPIIMLANTVHHWELEEGTPVKMYKAEQKYDDEHKVFLWDIHEVPVPSDNIIPLASILILAEPQDIVIPEGITVTQDSPHLLLPDIYVKRSINKVANALYMLNIDLFFGNLFIKGKTTEKSLLLLLQS